MLKISLAATLPVSLVAVGSVTVSSVKRGRNYRFDVESVACREWTASSTDALCSRCHRNMPAAIVSLFPLNTTRNSLFKILQAWLPTSFERGLRRRHLSEVIPAHVDYGKYRCLFVSYTPIRTFVQHMMAVSLLVWQMLVMSFKYEH